MAQPRLVEKHVIEHQYGPLCMFLCADGEWCTSVKHARKFDTAGEAEAVLKTLPKSQAAAAQMFVNTHMVPAA